MVVVAYDVGNMKALPDIDLPKLFKETREALGYTQQEMADKIGVHLQAYHKWEAGTRTPNGQAVAKLHILIKQIEAKKTL